MSVQLSLLRPPVVLTAQQSAVWELVKSRPEGVRAGEAVAIAHELRGKHSRARRCEWCATRGQDILAALIRKELVRRTRPGVGSYVYVARAAAVAKSDPDYDPFPDGF